MIELTIRKVGNSLGVILPAEAIKALGVTEGDILHLTESPDGYRLTPYDPSFAKQMKLAEEGMKQHRQALRELFKK